MRAQIPAPALPFAFGQPEVTDGNEGLGLAAGLERLQLEALRCVGRQRAVPADHLALGDAVQLPEVVHGTAVKQPLLPVEDRQAPRASARYRRNEVAAIAGKACRRIAVGDEATVGHQVVAYQRAAHGDLAAVEQADRLALGGSLGRFAAPGATSRRQRYVQRLRSLALQAQATLETDLQQHAADHRQQATAQSQPEARQCLAQGDAATQNPEEQRLLQAIRHLAAPTIHGPLGAQQQRPTQRYQRQRQEDAKGHQHGDPGDLAEAFEQQAAERLV